MFTRVVYGDAVIFSGNDVKALKQNLDLFGTSKLMGTASDPSSGGGLEAPLSSIAMNYLTGIAYIKTSAPNTGWSRIIDTSYAPSVYFKQGGNAFGATATLGTTDANRLDFITGSAIGMTLTTAGRLGIGTTEPGAALDVHSATNPIIQANSLGAYSSSGGGIMQVTNDAGSAITSGSRIGGLQFASVYDGTHTFNVGAAINGVTTEAWTSTANGTKLNLNVTPNGTTSRSTAMTIDQDSSVSITSSAFGSLSVGPNGTTNPTFLVDSSTASAVNGIKIIGNAAATSPQIITISSETNEDMALSSKGAGTTKLQVGGSNRYSVNNQAHIFAVGTSSTASTVRYQYTGAADTGLTASTEAPSVYFNIGQTREHETGALALQRDFRVTPSTHSFVGASTLTNAAGFSVDGAPIAGTNATITNSSSIYSAGQAVGAGVTNSYGLNIAANTGATNNYAATFSGGAVGIGTAAPASLLHLSESNASTGDSNGLTIEQVGTGDALMHFLLTGVQRYTMGIDNSDSDKFKIGTNADLTNNNLLTLTTTGALGLGTSTPAVQLHNLVTDAATNTVTNVATFGHNTSGTPAANYGVSIDLQMQDATVTNRQSFLLSSYWADATDATRSAITEFSSPNGGAVFKWMQFGRGAVKSTDILTSTTSTSITGGGAVLNLINTDATAGSVSRQFWLTENTLKGAWVTSANNSLYLGTGVGGSTVTQMTLLDNAGSPGSVGIGILAPTSKLHQDSGNATASYHQFTAGTTTGQTATDGTLIGIDASGNAIFNNQEAAYINFLSSNTQRARITALGSLVVGNNSSALATDATDGFLYISSSAGAPTGTPTTQTGSVPVHVDATNNAMYMYTNGAWRGVNNSAVQGSRQTGTSMSAATAITPALGVKSVAFVVGNGGAVTITASPPITTTGMIVGQELKICGTDNTNTVTYNNSVNLVLTGSATLGKDQCLDLMYAGTDGANLSWIETGRSF